jgi:hypothetical protein
LLLAGRHSTSVTSDSFGSVFPARNIIVIASLRIAEGAGKWKSISATEF